MKASRSPLQEAFEDALNEMDSLTDYDRSKDRPRCMAAVRKASNDLIRAAVDEARREGEELIRQEERALTVAALENAIRNPGGTFQMPLEVVMIEHRRQLAEARREEREACIAAISKQWPKARGLFAIARDAILARDKEPIHNCGGPAACADPDCKEFAR